MAISVLNDAFVHFKKEKKVTWANQFQGKIASLPNSPLFSSLPTLKRIPLTHAYEDCKMTCISSNWQYSGTRNSGGATLERNKAKKL